MWLMRCIYRFGQFAARVRVGRNPVDLQMAQSLLPEPAFRLFAGMPPGDQTHALCVLRTLRQQADSADGDIAQAALLHDVGKADGGLTLLHRVLIVLLEWLAGDLLRYLGRTSPLHVPLPGSWRYPFYVQVHHAHLGAQRCAQAGCAPSTIALVAYHESASDEGLSDPELRKKLWDLKRADDCC